MALFRGKNLLLISERKSIMKTSIKAIIAAATTAALSLGIVATATADMSVEPNIKSEESSSVEETEKTLADVSVEPDTETKKSSDLGEIDDELAKELEQLPADIQRVGSENAYTDFEMKLLECNPAPLFYHGVGTVYVPVNTPMQQSTDVKLTLVEDSVFDRWEGRFVVDSVNGFKVEFSEPDTFKCRVGFLPLFTSKSGKGMDSNYKTVKAVYTYRELDYRGIPIIATYPYENSGNDSKVLCWDDDRSGPKSTLVEATYYFTIYAGSNSFSPIHEMAMVHVVNSSYAQSAAYAQNSYANLIDKYTYVDTSEYVKEGEDEIFEDF